MNIKVRLSGAPPEEYTKEICVDECAHITDVKNRIYTIFKLNRMLNIQMIWRGKVLPDVLEVKEIPFDKDPNVVLIATQAGG